MGAKIVEVRKGQHYKLEVRDDFSKEVTFKQKKTKDKENLHSCIHITNT